MTRFATSYLTLGCLLNIKGALRRMFTSIEWKEIQHARTRYGKSVENMIMDNMYWKNIVTFLKGVLPLIKVLKLVDSNEKPTMGYIYEAMDLAKESIQKAFNGVFNSYTPLWERIDEMWDNQLHWPLYAVCYYLNPMLHYALGFKANYEVKPGMYDCLRKMVGGDIEIIKKVDTQLEDFKGRKKFFGSIIAIAGHKTKTLAQLRESYGDENPELQNFTIHVLSLTCSSFGYECPQKKKRNCMKQKTMNDVVFVMVNSKLENKKQTRKSYIKFNLDDISDDDEWIMNNNEDDENAERDNDDLNTPLEEALLEGGDGATTCVRQELEIPQFDYDDEVDRDEAHVEEPLDEINEDEEVNEDGYLDMPLRDLIY
ncbi:PREDICTED: uncharacterized protein LOC109353928 [Lupinus angustifolius]|uniref:uncharacterized protein LOC109353928 n=1 Tax=Lupinus angustifolius TaxID=3871 RepID=UPI00092FAD94|nr:PREDICTED: uncharacterized protein LOC109353928 [Lupinus angustifolius]